MFWARRWPRSTSLPSRLGGGAFRDHLVLACADAENRSVINQSPEWPRWLVEVLAASANDDEVVRAGGDLLDVQARHALKLREGGERSSPSRLSL